MKKLLLNCFILTFLIPQYLKAEKDEGHPSTRKTSVDLYAKAYLNHPVQLISPEFGVDVTRNRHVFSVGLMTFADLGGFDRKTATSYRLTSASIGYGYNFYESQFLDLRGGLGASWFLHEQFAPDFPGSNGVIPMYFYYMPYWGGTFSFSNEFKINRFRAGFGLTASAGRQKIYKRLDGCWECSPEIKTRSLQFLMGHLKLGLAL